MLLLAIAVLAGAAASEAIYRSPAARGALARFCGAEPEISSVVRHLRAASEQEAVTDLEIEGELNLLRDQFGDEDAFRQALASSNLSLGAIREEISQQLRARNWIEKQIASQFRAATQEESRQFYETHAAQFLQPQRYRASHIFLAAPEGTAPEVIATKQSEIQGLAVRILAGEPFVQLVAEASEDEATKVRGGDLGYFAAMRMPPEFIAEVEKLQPQPISAPFRTHLGFHIVQLTDAKPPTTFTFEEARPEIVLELENGKRAAMVAQLTASLNAGRAR